MTERRIALRKTVDMTIKRLVDGESCYCKACEISATGIRLKRMFLPEDLDSIVDMEVPLVEGSLTTCVTGRRVWRKGMYEAFEFINASNSQQAVLNRIYGREDNHSKNSVSLP